MRTSIYTTASLMLLFFITGSALAEPVITEYNFTTAEDIVRAASSDLTVEASDGSYATIEEFQASPQYAKFIVDNLWILIGAILVFIMHLGFASVESGLTQAKNTVNVIYKNVFILCMGILSYAFIGFQIMYPGEFNGFLGFGGFGIGFDPEAAIAFLTPAYGEEMTIWSDFIFQAMFAATAATIVSGCVTGRVKLSAYMVFGAMLVTFSYPVTGSWLWGGGWLDQIGFYDFAGSTVVHAVGGFAGLACVILLGARKGKFSGGKVNIIPGHNIPLATVGVFLLWFGWFGFNGASVLSADPIAVSFVFVTTALSASAGALGAMVAAGILMKHMDAPMALNGILAGLVGITAGADVVSPLSAVMIGGLSGVLVVAAINFFDSIRIDDPVGAISVHGVCGIWGTLAVGIFSAEASFLIQLIGTLSIIGFTLLFTFAVFGLIKATMGVRVTDEIEFNGLDFSEHGNNAYPDFEGSKRNGKGAVEPAATTA